MRRRNVAMAGLFGAALASGVGAMAADGYVEIDRKNFVAQIDGRPVDLYTIRNKAGMVVKITNYGARVEQILVPDKAGKLGDVALGYETLEQVMNGSGAMGSHVGRYANRIAKGTFTLDGETYHLPINNPPNHLHGGPLGSRFRVFDAKQLGPSRVEMRYTYQDGEQGYPGTVKSSVTYSVSDDNGLVIDYDAVTDRPTVVNFTNHTFFNLAGQGNGDILGHVLTIKAERYTVFDSTAIPTGEIRPVAGTPLDFTQPHRIGERIDADFDQLKIGKGYDNNFVLDKKPGAFGLAARVSEPRTGRVMEVWTTEPGMQVYTGNFLEGLDPRDIGKGKVAYTARTGVCFEPQHFPDSPNRPEFPSTVLRPGQHFTGKIVYRFAVER
jgi:aldose 1-epimerase